MSDSTNTTIASLPAASFTEGEATDLTETAVSLNERAVRSDGTVQVKIIQNGWGSSGYYSRDVLERDVPQAFPPGTHMFWNHATVTEEAERPEGDLSRLAAVTVSPATWVENGPAGSGMYADARVFGGYRETLEEIAPYIGVSIRGMGSSHMGEADGREGRIIDAITAGRSIDFVTMPGAGGQIVQLFEAAGREPVALESTRPPAANHTEDAMSEALQEAQTTIARLEQELETRDAALTEAQAAVAKLREMLLLREARDYVAGALAEADLPDVTCTRLQRQLTANPPVIDGKLDEATYKERIDTAVTEAQAEIAAIAGSDGRIRGQGGVEPAPSRDNIQEAQARLDKAMAALGVGGGD